METPSEQLRTWVDRCLAEGWTVNGIATAAGVPQSSLQRWLSGERPQLKSQTIDRLAAWLGVRFTTPHRLPRP